MNAAECKERIEFMKSNLTYGRWDDCSVGKLVIHTKYNCADPIEQIPFEMGHPSFHIRIHEDIIMLIAKEDATFGELMASLAFIWIGEDYPILVEDYGGPEERREWTSLTPREMTEEELQEALDEIRMLPHTK